MALFGPRFDLEAGEPVAAAWNGSMQPGPPPVLRHRAQASQRFIVGVVILLFLAGLVPFSSLLFLLLALFALASCIQYNAIVRQEADQRSNRILMILTMKCSFSLINQAIKGHNSQQLLKRNSHLYLPSRTRWTRKHHQMTVATATRMCAAFVWTHSVMGTN
ncbi:hypothetical protein WJX77_003174 [Trebouxia sp. C0004]